MLSHDLIRATVACALLSPGLLAPRSFASEAASATHDAAAGAEPTLQTIEVSATRLRGVADVDVPASVATVRFAADDNRPQVEVSEALAGIPGVTALDRQNYAQDTQLSIRGFGARASFGVRGLRLFADGVPASMPDGQGQLSHFSLMGADRLQVLRGPFSALYGNSSGGVVQLWSQEGRPGNQTRLRGTYGSYGERSLGAQTTGEWQALNYNLAATRFQTDGYRDHSAARRDLFNLRLGADLGASRNLVFTLNHLNLPEAQDALGQTPLEWRSDPRAATAVATQFNTRKTVRQTQGGLVFEQALGEQHSLRAMAYAGNRQVLQYLAIPVGVQGNALNSGGVVDLDNDYRGADLRWSWLGEWAGRRAEFTFGTNLDEQQQLRQGFNNFVGTTLGVRGTRRRDETNTVSNADQFAQLWWRITPRWSVLSGLRHSAVDFKSRDRYIVGSNPDDSGRRSYSEVTPVAGALFQANDAWRFYASVGEGFETPTFNELSYRADGRAGLAFDLKPANSSNVELGLKWRHAQGASLDAALFRARTQNELAVVRNVGGRSSFRNVGGAIRKGFELSVDLPLAQNFATSLAYTWLDANFTRSYLICAVAGCTVPNVTIPAGSRIPGVAQHQGQLQLRYSPGVYSAALEITGASQLVANDVASVRAPGYVLLNAELGRNWSLASGELRSFVRLDNLLDKTYVGSIIVNEGNGRFFESGSSRTGLVGLQWRWH